MERRPAQHFDRDLSAALVRGRSVSVPGFAERALVAVRADRLRRTVIRWGSGLSAAAAAVVTRVERLLSFPFVAEPAASLLRAPANSIIIAKKPPRTGCPS